MLLPVFVVCQLVLDVALVALLVVALLRRKAEPAGGPTTPPAWHAELVALTQELLAVTEPILDALESRGSGPGGSNPAPAPPGSGQAAAAPDPYREAFALVRAGVVPEEVARRGALSPGELRLIQNLVAAESRAGHRSGE